jgi:hypothetical protein
MHRARESTAPEMTMRILAAILSVAVLMWVEAAGAQTTYRLSVSVHHALPPLSKRDVKRILARASKMLQKNSHHNDDDDFACNVTFTLKGPVRTFPRPDTPEVPPDTPELVDASNIDAVHRVDSNITGVDFRVKIVKEIHFCRPDLPDPDGPFEGCSFSRPDFRSMILVHHKRHKDLQGRRVSNYPDHLLWAHEFGHLTGLGHRRDPFGRDRFALMTHCSLTQFSDLPDTRVQVNRAECGRLRSGPGAQPAEAFGCAPPR